MSTQKIFSKRKFILYCRKNPFITKTIMYKALELWVNDCDGLPVNGGKMISKSGDLLNCIDPWTRKSTKKDKKISFTY